jgi:serine protease AprX
MINHSCKVVLAFTLLVLALWACLAAGSSSAQTTAPGSKLSPDLRLRGNDGSHIRVIVQPTSKWNPLLDSVLRDLGGILVETMQNLPLQIVSLPANRIEEFAASDQVHYVSPDREINMLGHVTSTTGADAVRTENTTSILNLVKTTNLDGSGIGIAIVDSGIDARHKSFSNSLGLSRVIANRDFTGEDRTDDPYGHGTHVAGLAAGNGQVASGAYTGIASNANLINLRVLDSQGVGRTSNLIRAIDWVMGHRTLYNIRVVNMSLGQSAIDSYKNDPLCQAVRRLVDAGIVVVAAAGNNGKNADGLKVYGRIHSPGNEPSAITVGASNSYGTNERGDDGVASFSSRGPTRSFSTDESGVRHYDNLLKPDIVAPGNKLVSAAAFRNLILTQNPQLDANVSTSNASRMMYMSGSSMSAPVAAGTAALLLQANPRLKPNLVKVILMYTAQPLAGYNTFEQGAGQLNVAGAVRLAKLIRFDLLSAVFVPSLGEPLLSGAPPVPRTTIANQTFSWAQGIILNHTYATGVELITKYQRVYGVGMLLGDGVTETPTLQTINFQMMTSGIDLGTSILTSNASSLGSGQPFLTVETLLGNGVVIGDGVLLGDGVVIGDGTLLGDGVLIGDSVRSQ